MPRAVFVVAVASIAMPVAAHWGGESGHAHMWTGMGWGGGWFFWPIVLVIGGLAFVLWLARNGTGTRLPPSDDIGPSNDPVTELKLRFARGEIDEAEFEHRKRLLEA